MHSFGGAHGLYHRQQVCRPLLPLYRLEKIRGERYKAPIRRQRMCDWIGYVVDNWLNLICHSIRQGLFKSDYLQIDETPIRYLDNERKGKSHKVTSGPRATSALTGSLLQSDGYIVYDSVTRDTDIIQLGCWAHARRKFFKAFQEEQLKAARLR